MPFTHQKRPYKAICLQWNGHNTDEVMEMLVPFASVTPYTYGKETGSSEYIMIRFFNKQEDRPDIHTMCKGEWVVQGENGDVKCYDDDVFHIKYQELA